jgi:hypothetical protein
MPLGRYREGESRSHRVCLRGNTIDPEMWQARGPASASIYFQLGASRARAAHLLDDNLIAKSALIPLLPLSITVPACGNMSAKSTSSRGPPMLGFILEQALIALQQLRKPHGLRYNIVRPVSKVTLYRLKHVYSCIHDGLLFGAMSWKSPISPPCVLPTTASEELTPACYAT